MAVLRAIKGIEGGPILPLKGQCADLGRHPDCDIVLEAGAVSRQHARILKLGEEYFLEDLHSRNGTYLNDQRVEVRQRLNEGDQIRICDLTFVFHSGNAEEVLRKLREAPSSEPVVLVDEASEGTSTVMSKLPVSGSAGLKLTINPEVKLRALLEISRNLAQAVALSDVLTNLLDSLFAVFIQADRAFIALRDPATGKLIPKAFKQRRENTAEPVRISRTIVNEVLATKEAVLSADAATDKRFDMSESIVDYQIHSIMCVPLIGSSGSVLGVIQVDTKDHRRRFSHDDLEVLASVGCQASVTVENTQLHELVVQEHVLQRELALAHKVQQGLLPAKPPQVPGYEFFDFYEPANQLGGDYFDYIPLSGNRLGVALADVSGKGIAASLLMARLSAEVRYCLASLPSPTDAMARLNNVFCENRWEDRFVTLALAILDPVKHEVTIVNAGHLWPLLRRVSGKIEALSETTGGLPLGINTDQVYQQETVQLGLGEILMLYTDGLPEAMNVLGQCYSNERLRTQLEKEAPNMVVLGQRILDDVRRFVGNRPQSDDMCLTCLRRVE